MIHVKVETGIKIPPKQARAPWTEALLTLKAGESFMVQTNNERRTVLAKALREKINVTSRKINGCGFRIWRI